MSYDEMAQIFRALAHPARAQILDLLCQGELCVCDIIAELQLEQSNVSQHLSLLRGQNLVQTRKDGNRVLYALTCPCIGGLMSAAKRVIAEKPSFRYRES